MKTNKGDFFHLLYFSPRPEDGEQICVALIVHAGGQWLVEFDEKLTRMKTIASGHDVEFVRGVLDNLRAALDGRNLHSLLSMLEPQLRISDPRPLLVPFSEELRKQLRRRFLRPEKLTTSPLERERELQLQQNIRQLVTEIIPSAEPHFVSSLKPEQLFGHDFARVLRNAKPISRAIVGRSRAVLIDGVDTSVKPSTDVIQKANRIAFTFWQYGKVIKSPNLPSQAPQEILRVGIVFNGYPKAEIQKEYALHQFSKDADLAIDAHAKEGVVTLREEIAKTLADLGR